MKKNLSILAAMMVSLPVVFSQSVAAHVIWFESQKSNYQLIFGHPELNDIQSITLSKFQGATAYDAGKNSIPVTTDFIGGELFVTPQSQASALTAFYDNGYWIQNPDGSSTNLTTEQAAAIAYQDTTNYVKYTKYLAQWSNVLAEPFGLPLEIIPLANPLGLESGDQLPIQVLYQGNLLLNPTVEYLGNTLTLDAAGVAIIPIGDGGLQVIEASYTDPGAIDPGISYATTLAVQPTAVPEPSLVLGFGILGFSFLARKRQKS